MSGPWIAAFIALAGCVVLLGFFVVGLMRRLIPLLEQSEATLKAALLRVRVSGLPAGAAVPAFIAERVGGGTFSDSDLLGARSVVLFVNSACTACGTLFTDLRDGPLPDLNARLVVVTHEEDAGVLVAAIAGGVPVLSQRGHSVSRVFESDRSPHVFVLDEDAVVRASGWPNDWTGIQNLASSAWKGGDAEVEVAAVVLAGQSN